MIIYYVYLKYLFYAFLAVVIPVGFLLILKLIQKVTLGKCKSLTCLKGKTVLIVGCTSGVGFETALNLASRGCRLIIANKEGGDRAKRQIIKHTNNEDIIIKKVDFSSLDSVRNLAEELKETEEKLDILINNADKWLSTNKHTEDGLHELMQINYFGPFLLTYLLIDLLKKAAPSRIIFVSSAASYFSNLSIENLNYPKDHPLSWFRTSLIYGNAKLCKIIAANNFAEKLDEFGISCNSLHPGYLNGDHFSHSEKRTVWDQLEKFLMNPVAYLYGKTPDEGAQTILHLALSKKMQDVTGKYFVDCMAFPLPFGARNKRFCSDIFEESELMVRLKKHELLSVDSKPVLFNEKVEEIEDVEVDEVEDTEDQMKDFDVQENLENKSNKTDVEKSNDKLEYIKNENNVEKAFTDSNKNQNINKLVCEKDI